MSKIMLNEFHGSDIEAVSAAYSISKDSIICYSDNVNPLGIPPMLEKAIADNIHSIENYPDRSYITLKESVARYCHINANQVFVGSGVTDIISRIAKCLSPKKALVVEPTYSQYIKSFKQAGAQVLRYVLRKEDGFLPNVNLLKTVMGDDCDVMVLCNPNNPTGIAIKLKELKKILDLCKNNNIFLIIDETYVEFSNELEKISGTSLISMYSNLCIMRGISKFFASPGLRFGYGITVNADLIKKIENEEEAWGIHSIAAESVPYMFEDKKYIENTRNFIQSEKEIYIKAFSQCKKIFCYPSDTNFILIEILDKKFSSKYIFEKLITKGIMVRDCSSFEGLGDNYFRICIKNREENRILIENLNKIFM